MTRLAFGAFGANSIQADGLSLIGTGVPTVVASPFTGGGPYAMQCVGSTVIVGAQWTATLTDARGYYLRARVRISGTPTADTYLMGFTNLATTSSSALGLALLNGSRDIRLFGGAAVRDVAGPTLAINTDYLLELYVMYNTVTSLVETITGRVDGTQFATFSGGLTTAFGSNPSLGLSANAGITATYTDWAFNDDQGSDNNSWPGDARVAMLLPVSDDGANSTISADAWRLINSGTTNLYTGVDNTPPTGATSPGSGTSQIVCDTPSVARNYTTVTETYASKIAAGDTITLAQGIVVNGESVSTGTKTGSSTLFANPSSGSTAAFTFGADAGAAGAYPTLWSSARTPLSVLPTPTRSTGCSIRVTADISTRNEDVCFMGVYVEYTLAPVAQKSPPPFSRPWRFWTRRR